MKKVLVTCGLLLESRAKSGRKSEGFSETLDFRRESALDV